MMALGKMTHGIIMTLSKMTLGSITTLDKMTFSFKTLSKMTK
jgi:hypothetical protein